MTEESEREFINCLGDFKMILFLILCTLVMTCGFNHQPCHAQGVQDEEWPGSSDLVMDVKCVYSLYNPRVYPTFYESYYKAFHTVEEGKGRSIQGNIYMAGWGVDNTWPCMPDALYQVTVVNGRSQQDGEDVASRLNQPQRKQSMPMTCIYTNEGVNAWYGPSIYGRLMGYVTTHGNSQVQPCVQGQEYTIILKPQE